MDIYIYIRKRSHNYKHTHGNMLVADTLRMVKKQFPAVCMHSVLKINKGSFSRVFMFLDSALSTLLEI
jgi:hypothetical protein